MSAYKQLETIFTELSHLEHAHSIMAWDEAVMMPSGGSHARAKAMATLQCIRHNRIKDPKINDLILAAKEKPLSTPWQTANLRWIEKIYKNAACIPESLIAEITEATVNAEQAWRKYRAENNWHDFAPLLQKNIDLIKKSAEIRAEVFNQSVYDVLLDDYSPDINQEFINPIFAKLKDTLPSIINTITEKQKNQDVIELNGPFPINKQTQLGVDLMLAIGFDFNRGRLDISHHPFCGGVPDDVRMTTRYNEQEFITAIMGICHETGHARYEQALPKEWLNQPVGRTHNMTIHESQSLLIEMQACRTPEFINFLSTLIKNHFGDQNAFQPANLYRLHTRIKQQPIRVDADEVTYPLHVILRYDIEKAIFDGQLSIADIPNTWNELMQKYLNVSTQNDYKNGVMQDVHWAAGLFGYFPSYTLGSLTAAQLFHTAINKHPKIPEQLAQGNFSTLYKWLHKNIHSRASSVNFDRLMQDATGEKLNPNYFIEHIERRYTST